MVFSSIPFLYYFLPAVLAVYFLTPRKGKNAVLLLASLIFYGWGELRLLPLPRDTLLGQLRRDFPQAQPEDLEAAAQRSGGNLGQAKALMQEGLQLPPQTEGFLQALCQRSPLLLMQTLVPLEKWKRDALGDLLSQWVALTEAALVNRSGLTAVSPGARQLAAVYTSTELHKILSALQKGSLYLQSNVSPGAVCGYLEWELQVPKK